MRPLRALILHPVWAFICAFSSEWSVVDMVEAFSLASVTTCLEKESPAHRPTRRLPNNPQYIRPLHYPPNFAKSRCGFGAGRRPYASNIHHKQAAPTGSPSDTYDFVIAGGGTAGISLAARLTENPAFKVLVIEAGPPPDSINQDEAIPGIDFFLEGSSVMNFMAFNRGSSSLYDLWESMGNPGWDWKTVFPFFKKYAHFTPPNTSNNSQITFDSSLYDPAAGPLQISYGQDWSPKIRDLNAGHAVGVAHTTTTINPADQSRSSAYTTFYAQAKNRPNLHVFTDTMVEQVLLRKYRNASGVVGTAFASKEVIISTGAIQTPQLLMLSGIGPKAILDKFKIPAFVYNDGLGQRLQDHPSFYINIEVPSSLTTIGQLLQNPATFGQIFAQYQQNHTGPLASMNGDTLGFQRFPDKQLKAMGAKDLIALGDNWPNVEYLLLPAYNNPGFPTAPNATGNYVTVLVALVSATSLGTVGISSTNINDPPIIDVNYFATKDDQQVAIQGLKNALAIAQSKSFKPIFLGRDKVVPPPNITTDAQILNYVRQVTTTIWHGSGTAAMMPRAKGGVVDNKLRVYGVNKLRIVDASIQPRITNQHVQAVVYMIAERAAEFLRQQYS
ncbi:hypothetical protein BD779DRAFT_1470039 [Infundibulicybe gibba]|nr:hypothetical protein BD779DRAFT_1470039 [Infundibulicybe gibba]